MVRHFFKIALRNLERNKAYTLINVICLALGITCAILTFTLIKYHLSFDTFHSNIDRIHRITIELHQQGISREPNVPQPIGKAFRDDYTFSEKVAMVYSISDKLVSIASSEGDKRFKENIAYTEREFFDILNFPLIQGNKNTILTEPNTAIITERIAEKYFGDQNPINRVIRIDNQWDFRITGILKDLPVNTDRKDE